MISHIFDFSPHILREDSHFESYFLAGLKPPPLQLFLLCTTKECLPHFCSTKKVTSPGSDFFSRMCFRKSHLPEAFLGSHSYSSLQKNEGGACHCGWKQQNMEKNGMTSWVSGKF